MDAQTEAKYDKMIDDVGKHHQACPLGRNFLAFGGRDRLSKEALRKYRENFDRVFPNAPGANI